MALGMVTLYNFVVKSIWPLARELLFGKYRLADYFRARKIVLLLLILYTIIAGLYINMVENALITNQHIRHMTKEHQSEISKLNNTMELQRKQTQDYRTRLAMLCQESESFWCLEGDLTKIEPTDAEAL